MQPTRFSDKLYDLIGQYGQTTLANEIGMDCTGFSRFKNGEGGIGIGPLDKLFVFGRLMVISQDEYWTFLRMRSFDGQILGRH